METGEIFNLKGNLLEIFEISSAMDYKLLIINLTKNITF